MTETNETDFHKCGKVDCFRKVSPASRYCCTPCADAAEAPAPFEIEPFDPALHPFLCHSRECEGRKDQRGEYTFREVERMGL